MAARDLISNNEIGVLQPIEEIVQPLVACKLCFTPTPRKRQARFRWMSLTKPMTIRSVEFGSIVTFFEFRCRRHLYLRPLVDDVLTK
jgi:hypothetical protein